MSMVVGRFGFKVKTNRTPIPFMKHQASPTGYQIHLALKLALTTVLKHHNNRDDSASDDNLITELIDSGGECRIQGRDVSRTNFEFSKSLVQMISMFIAFNDYRFRSKSSSNDSTDIAGALRVNQECLYQYISTIFNGDHKRRDLLFHVRDDPLEGYCVNTHKILENMKNIYDRAKGGIACNWTEKKDHKKCLFVHHFAVYQTFHTALMVVNKSSDGKLMTSECTIEFHGGDWQDYFTYNDDVDHVGSQITWKGMGLVVGLVE